MHLSHAGLLREDKDFAGALEIYAEHVKPEFPEVAKDRTWTALNEAFEESRRQRHGFKAVIELCQQGEKDLLGTGNAAEIMGLTYKAWGYALLDRKDYVEARKAFNQHYAYAPAERKPLLARVDYREMSAGLTDKTPKDHFDLGVFCRQNGLFEEASEEFALAGRDDDWRDLVDMQLGELEQERYEGKLYRAIELNEQGRYHEARELIAFLLKRIKGKEMREIAEGVSRLVEASFEQAKSRAPMEAEMKWESFERYSLVDPDLALNILDEILRDYSGTPAAERARQWRPKILSLRLNNLEKRPGNKVESHSPPNEEEQAFDGPVDPELLQRELRRIYQALETGAKS